MTRPFFRRVRASARRPARLVSSAAGFTLMQLMIGITLAAVMTALALPTITAWRKGQQYRMGAKNVESTLREARSKAIANNRQYMVAFKPNSSCYQIFEGTLSYNTPSSGFSVVPGTKALAPNSLLLRTGLDGTSQANVYVQFYPNGTAAFLAPDKIASGSNVWVNDATGQKYKIDVSATGRVTLTKVY